MGKAGQLNAAMSDIARYKAAAQAIFEVWSTGKLHRLDAIVSPDVMHHDPHDPNGAAGLAGMKKTIERSRSLSPDLKIRIEDQLADGNRVATRWMATMTRDGKRVAISGITIDRFEDGKIVEAWRCMDMLGLMRQLGDANLR